MRQRDSVRINLIASTWLSRGSQVFLFLPDHRVTLAAGCEFGCHVRRRCDRQRCSVMPRRLERPRSLWRAIFD